MVSPALKNIVPDVSSSSFRNLHRADSIVSIPLKNLPKSRPKDRYKVDTGVRGYLEESDSRSIYIKFRKFRNKFF